MKVAHRDDYDTHAVIGGKNVEEFAIAQTAEFFTVLSNTLYSNKPLAVVREVLCNAWDANIVAKRTDKPVLINIDEDKMSIKDAGFGIPHDMIHQIYCVYGNSTKENDGLQTGGFGLGSKSPFAYGDHFSVVNCHDGIKQVHAISRGSALTKGKPDRRVMVSVPTTEEGVEVIIPVKNAADRDLFIQIARDIAAFGEMNVILNGKPVEQVPISSAEGNMFLTNRKPRGVHNKLALRYGNVVYPIQPDEEYTGVYNEIIKLIKNIPNRARNTYDENDFIMILQAPPNSISVTPSRESISNTETTITTLRALMTGVIEYMKSGTAMFESKLLEEHAKALEMMWKNGKEDRIMFAENLLTDDFGSRPLKDQRAAEVYQINSLTGLADYYLRYSKNIGEIIQKKLNAQKLDYQIERGFRRVVDLHRFRRIQSKKKLKGWKFDFFKKEIWHPLWKRVAKHGLLKVKNLQVAIKPTRNVTRYTWIDHTKYQPDEDMFLPLLQGVIIVTHSKMAYEEEWEKLLPDLRHTVPRDIPRLVYIAPRTKGHAAAAVELFEKLGYYVIDYAKIVDDYKQKNYIAVPKEMRASLPAARKKNKGLVLLRNSVEGSSKKNFSLTAHLREGAPRSEAYGYILKPYDLSGRRGYSKQMFPWGNDHASELALLFGSQIGLVVSDKQYESQKKQGKKDALRFIMEQVGSRVLTSSSIRTYVENTKGERETSTMYDTMMEIANHSTVLTKIFGLPPVTDESDLTYYQLYLTFERLLRYGNQPDDKHYLFPIWEAKQVVDTWVAADFYVKTEARLKASKGLKFLELDRMKAELKRMSRINPDYQTKVFIETSIINALKF